MIYKILSAILTAVLLLMVQSSHAKTGPQGQNMSLEEQKRLDLGSYFNQFEQLQTQGQPAQPNQQMAGGKPGWSGSGGGSGVICHSQRVLILDHFEFANQRWILPYHNERAGDFLNRLIKDYFTMLSPYFTSQLEIALEKIQARPWIPYVNIPEINDKGRLAKSLGSACKPVQVAARTREGQVYYDPNLMSQIYASNVPRIATLNTVILILHEALYLMGVEMNHQTSASSRKVLAKLLDLDLYEMTTRFKGHRLAVLQAFFEQENFGYFNLLFGSVDSVALMPAPESGLYNKASRRKSYAQFQAALKSIGSTMSGYGARVEAIQNYMDQTASDEIVFLYLAQNEDVNPPDPIPFPHPENLLVDGKDDQVQIHAICEEITWVMIPNEKLSSRSRSQSKNPQRALRVFQKAERYCQQLNLPRCPSYARQLGALRNLRVECY